MNASNFKDKNVDIAKNQDEYNTLPALYLATSEGRCITRWTFSWKEKLRVLFGYPLWMTTMTFGKPFMPVRLSMDRKEHYLLPTDKGYDTAQKLGEANSKEPKS